MTELRVPIRQLAHGRGLPLPDYLSDGSAGMDLAAALGQDVTLAPGEWARIPTGLAIALPLGFEAQVRTRSGLAADHGVTVLNSPGTIDADYRGEVGVVLVNLGSASFTIRRGMRVAQLVVAPVSRVSWAETAALPESGRGAGGFGSTGLEPPAVAVKGMAAKGRQG